MKLTSGILARDKDNDAVIVFFRAKPELNQYGRWNCASAAWTYDGWQAEYDLKPPAPSKCFEVDIEL